jgi:predicted TIM-barrel fold metal-dependent hydrolase
MTVPVDISCCGKRDLMSVFPVVDSHGHLWAPDLADNMVAICDHLGFARMGLVCVIDPTRVSDTAAAIAAKYRYPNRFYLLPGLDHSGHYSGGKLQPPPLAEQARRLRALGADGIKMLEAKPTSRKFLDIPVDSDYFAEFFATVEEMNMPLVWHVADPEEFWDPQLTPSWARERGWGYDDSFVPKEQFYTEVGNVLSRHPRLQVVFAHFYFLSAQLDRAEALLKAHPGVHLDLAPGIELLYNLSRDLDRTRAFFETYADRIVFGTDISGNQTPAEAGLRAGIVTRWLQTDETYRVPDGADFLLGPAEDGIIHGLNLSEQAQAKILGGNFMRLVGEVPRPLDRDAARAECERLAPEESALSAQPLESTSAWQAAQMLA